MGRAPCCERMGLKKGAWTPEEDQILISYIQRFGHANWRALPKHAGLLRCGKSCRLRWTNYLRPDIKRGNFSPEEEETIIKLHDVLGNRWSAIAARLPGRTDNEIKNVWHTHLKKRLLQHQHNHSTSNNNHRRRITTRHDLLPIKSESTIDDIDHLETMVSSEPADDDDQHLLVISPNNNNSGADSPVQSSYSCSFDDISTVTTTTAAASINNLSTTTISNSNVEGQYNCDSNDNSSFSALHLNDGFWAQVLSGADLADEAAGLQSTSSSSPNYHDNVNMIMNNNNRDTVDDNMEFLYDDYHLSGAAFEETQEFIMEILRGTT